MSVIKNSLIDGCALRQTLVDFTCNVESSNLMLIHWLNGYPLFLFCCCFCNFVYEKMSYLEKDIISLWKEKGCFIGKDLQFWYSSSDPELAHTEISYNTCSIMVNSLHTYSSDQIYNCSLICVWTSPFLLFGESCDNYI